MNSGVFEAINTLPVELLHFYVADGHNYFGRHGGPAGDFPIKEVDQLECVAGRGIAGDRFFDRKPDYKGQITFFAEEIFQQLRADLRISEEDRGALRRNVIIKGVNLTELIGREFELQGVRFSGSEECRPCYWMDGALAPGADNWLKGRGGLRARILTPGILRVTRGNPTPLLLL